jgi:hypothetical protein
LYTVRFTMSELWGDSAEGPGYLHLDLWEGYMESWDE